MIDFKGYSKPGLCSIERADSRDRGPSTGNRGGGSSGGNGGSHGGNSGSGAYNGQGRPNTVAAAAPAGPTGTRGPVGPGGAAGFTNATLGVGSPYQGALSDYNNKSWVGRQVNVTPDPSRPATYANGISHFGMNIPGALLGTAASAFLPGMGIPVSMGAGAAFRAMGIPDTVFGSGTGAAPQPGQGFNYSGVGQQGRFGQGTGVAGQAGMNGPGAGAAGHLNNLANLNSQISGTAGAPVGSGTTPTATTPDANSLDWLTRLGRMQQITPGYGVSLPSYKYTGKATV